MGVMISLGQGSLKYENHHFQIGMSYLISSFQNGHLCDLYICSPAAIVSIMLPVTSVVSPIHVAVIANSYNAYTKVKPNSAVLTESDS